MNKALGFTLLELLIGLTLLGFLLALLFGGFRLASMSWDSVETHLERTSKEQMARSLVRRLLTQMQPVRWQKAPDQAIAFVGEPERLAAIAPLGGALGQGLQAVEFSIQSSGATGLATRLLFRHTAINQDAEFFAADIAQAKEHVILDGLVTAQFGYFGSAKKGEAARWQEIWTNPEELPLLVRIRLESADAGWADMIVMPMLRGTGCRWDDFQKRCR